MPHDHSVRLAAKRQLKYPAVVFTGIQARAVGRGIAVAVSKLNIVAFAASVMPDHVHAVVALHQRLSADELIAAFKRFATRQLSNEDLHPFADRRLHNGRLPSPWADGGWKVYLDTDDDMCEAIQYVEENPVKAGLPRQRWPFVQRFES
jgi:REP element-mobilizing transposase RayT